MPRPVKGPALASGLGDFWNCDLRELAAWLVFFPMVRLKVAMVGSISSSGLSLHRDCDLGSEGVGGVSNLTAKDVWEFSSFGTFSGACMGIKTLRKSTLGLNGRGDLVP